MSLNERSYSSHLFRPRPEIHIEGSGHLIIVATPWGPRSSAKKIIQVIQDYFHSVQHDSEATSPFSRLTCLSPLANDLRIAIKLANDTIYNEDNKSEFISGVELFIMAKRANQIAWAQIGYPYILLDRPNHPLTAIGSQLDLSIEFSLNSNPLPPLPSKMLGIDSSSDFSVETMRPAPQDKFILIARSGLPSNIFSLNHKERTVAQLSKLMSENNAELPFWLGILDLASV